MRSFLILLSVLVLTACTLAPPVVVDDTAQEEAALTQEDVGQALLAKERQWLDRWAAGNPLGCIEILADDASCFDFGGTAKTRLDGIEAIRNYLASFVGQIPPHTYELVDPRVQVFGDTAVVTLRYNISMEGEQGPAWKATDVYHRSNGDWKIEHLHWSLVVEE